MSLVHADNFNYYGAATTAAQDGIYVQISGTGGFVADPDGVSSERVIWMVGGNNGELRLALKNPTEKVGVALRAWVAGLPSNDNQLVVPAAWKDVSNNLIAYIQIMTNGSIKFWMRNAANTAYTAVGDTIVPVVTANGWYHIEAAFEASTTAAGTAEVRVEGVTVIDVAALDTYVGTIFQVSQIFGTSTGGFGVSHYYKDYVIWDGDGTMNNDFIGACIVAELIPDGDVTAGGWTSTGANIYGVLDNAAPDNAQYISADDTPPAFCEVTLTNLPADITSVKGLISVVRAAKVDGGDGNLQNSIRSDGDLSEGADRPITAAQLYWTDVHELDPATDSPWVPGAVDLATLVIDRTV